MLPENIVSLNKLSPNIASLGKIHFKTHCGHLSILPEEILFCKAEGSYTRVFIMNCREILISKPLKAFITFIPRSGFLRCHYSYLIISDTLTL
ncbi:MAG: LytTR family transcriptional regulator [Bacteroidetes bacterium]|nr:MAG: LytTR family transcriptional regulator [Bacteroidota bacterium]